MKIFVNQNLNLKKNPPKNQKKQKQKMPILSFHFDTYTCDNTSALVLFKPAHVVCKNMLLLKCSTSFPIYLLCDYSWFLQRKKQDQKQCNTN